jgi:hypothetical protein
MDTEQFGAVAPLWWLPERDLEHRMEDLRWELGASFGWAAPAWYTERTELEESYDYLQVHLQGESGGCPAAGGTDNGGACRATRSR